MIKAAVIGNPIKHSRSPLIHNYWLRKNKIEGSYETIEAEDEKDFENVVDRLVETGYSGFNITVPFKGKALELCDSISIIDNIGNGERPVENLIGPKSINIIKIIDGKLVGFSSDFHGFNLAVNHKLKYSPFYEFKGFFKKTPNYKNVTIIGAGGAARAIAYGLTLKTVPDIKGATSSLWHINTLEVINRSENKAKDLVEEISETYIPSEHETVRTKFVNKKLATNCINSDCDILINCSSIGMEGQTKNFDLDLSSCKKKLIVMDIVYSPRKTKLLENANSLGLETVGGLGMLVFQAIPAFKAFYGVNPDPGVLANPSERNIFDNQIEEIFNLLDKDLT